MNTFFSKHKKTIIITAIAAIAIIAVLCVLTATKPPVSELKDSIPEDFASIEVKQTTELSEDYGFISCYVCTKRIGQLSAERVTFMGFAGKVIRADKGIANAIVNIMLWLPSLMEGAKITILLTIASVVVGILLSIFLALGKMSKIFPIRWFCQAYIFFFRGTPLLMQLFFIYFGLPYISEALIISDRFTAAWIAFSLNSAAYCAEIIRAGIQSIDKGQFEAAKALGFSYGKTMSKIIIPQTYRRLIPPISNEFIMVIKDASLTSIIALSDLSKVTQSILTSQNAVLVFLPSMAIYLIITAFFTKLFDVLEKKFSIYE